MATSVAPMLRYRDGPTDREFPVPTTIMGQVSSADIAVVTISSRGRDVAIYLADLLPLFDSSALTLGVMLDAAQHKDQVKISLTKERVTYDNPAQLARFKTKEAEEAKA